MQRGYNGSTISRLLVLPIVLIIIAFVGFVIVKTLVDIEPEFGNTGWEIYGTTILAIIAFIAYSWLQGIRGQSW